ncbi:MAG TPA: hypothetical protein VL172_12890, partial [Kofleriaceae bacterium]|nr:hypothetical protein [Kofleriaceae bacterium]
SCRSCGGPLPAAAEDRLVVACVYCGSDNLLGLDLRRQAARARSQERSVRAATRRRWWARLRLLIVVPLAAGALYLLARELAFTAHWETHKKEPWSSCLFCKAASGKNHDGRPRALVVRQGERRRRFVVPPHAAFTVECEEGCTVEAGGHLKFIEGGEQLDIEDGALR